MSALNCRAIINIVYLLVGYVIDFGIQVYQGEDVGYGVKKMRSCGECSPGFADVFQ